MCDGRRPQQSAAAGGQPSGDHQPIELLSHGAELDGEVGGQVLDINFAWLCDAVMDRWRRNPRQGSSESSCFLHILASFRKSEG
jgi:hypothetical protein